MADSAAHARSRERVVRLCQAGADSRDLRLRLLDELRATAGFDAYAFLLTDPETSVGCSPVADVPGLPLDELPRLIRLKYQTRVNRWTALKDIALASEGQGPSRSLLWRELLHDHGVRDIASMVFRDRFGCWGFLDLYRYDSVFTHAEASYLARLTEPVTTGLRRSQAETFVVRPPDAPRPGPLVLMLSPELRVCGQTPDTHAYLSVLVPPRQGRPPVPASAYNVAAQHGRRGGSRHQRPPCPGAPGGRPVADLARRPDRRRGSAGPARYRRDHRGEHSDRATRRLHQGVRPEHP